MIIGSVVQSPELRYTPDGMPVARFPVAVSRQWHGPAGEPRESTEWFNVVAWRDLAELAAERLAKGRLVYVEGSQQTRSWTDRSGQEQYRVELVAQELTLLDSDTSRHPGV